MKSILVTVVVALALLAPRAEAREDPVLDQMLDALEELALSAPDQAFCEDVLSDYAVARAKALGTIAKTMDADRKKPCLDAWERACTKAGTELAKILDRRPTRRSSEPEFDTRAELFLEAWTSMEHHAFHQLRGSQLPRERDQLLERLEALRKMSKTLDAKWKAITAKDDKVDDDRRKALEEVQKLYDEVAKQHATFLAKGGERIREYVSRYNSVVKKLGAKAVQLTFTLWLKDPAMGKKAGELTKMALEATHYYHQRFNTVVDRTRRLENLLAAETTIVITFANTRKDVMKFLDEHHASVVEKGIERARKSAKKHTFFGTPLTKPALEEVVAMYNEYDKTFSSFVREHETVFFGPMGKRVTDGLLEAEESKRTVQSMRAIDLSQMIQHRYFSGSTFFDIDLSSLSSEDREYLREEILEPSMKKMIAQLKKHEKQLGKTRKELIEARFRLLDSRLD